MVDAAAEVAIWAEVNLALVSSLSPEWNAGPVAGIEIWLLVWWPWQAGVGRGTGCWAELESLRPVVDAEVESEPEPCAVKLEALRWWLEMCSVLRGQ